MTNSKFGLSTWDDEGNKFTKRNDKQFDGPKIPFLKLKEGNNVLRLITAPYKYFSIDFKLDPEQKNYGTRVKCSDPIEDCLTKQTGYKQKAKYYVGVIDRSDSSIKILDMGSSIFDGIKSLKEDIEWGDPVDAKTAYDITIRKNSKNPPASFYTCIPRGKAPLSEADLKLKSDVEEALVASLERLSAPLSVEKVKALLDAAGYTGGRVAPLPVSKKNTGDAKLAESTDDDYNFNEAAPN